MPFAMSLLNIHPKTEKLPLFLQINSFREITNRRCLAISLASTPWLYPLPFWCLNPSSHELTSPRSHMSLHWWICKPVWNISIIDWEFQEDYFVHSSVWGYTEYYEILYVLLVFYSRQNSISQSLVGFVIIF